MISRISSSPFPPYLISGKWKYSSGRKKSLPSRYRGVGISTVQKKTTHSLQVKDLYHRAGTDHLKRLKIKNQLRKWLKRTTVTAGGGSSFWRVWKHACQEKILKIYAPNEAIWGYSTSFHKFFFSPLKIQNFLRLWLDKDIRNGELLIFLLYPFVGSSSWQNTRSYKICSLSIEQKSLLSEKCLVFSCPPPNVPDMSTESAVHPLLSHLDVDFIKGSISQTRRLEVPSLHLFLSLYTCKIFARSFLVICSTMVSTGPGFLESRPTCTCERQCESLL